MVETVGRGCACGVAVVVGRESGCGDPNPRVRDAPEGEGCRSQPRQGKTRRAAGDLSAHERSKADPTFDSVWEGREGGSVRGRTEGLVCGREEAERIGSGVGTAAGR